MIKVVPFYRFERFLDSMHVSAPKLLNTIETSLPTRNGAIAKLRDQLPVFPYFNHDLGSISLSVNYASLK